LHGFQRMHSLRNPFSAPRILQPKDEFPMVRRTFAQVTTRSPSKLPKG
jgi:hypothetical protein